MVSQKPKSKKKNLIKNLQEFLVGGAMASHGCKRKTNGNVFCST
jgi:hypothetical protein